MTRPCAHLGALGGAAGPSENFYAASVVDKAGHLTSNAVGSPSQPLGGALQGKHESERQAEDGQDGQDGRMGDLKATQATSSYSSYSLDPRPCLRKTPAPVLEPYSVNGRQGRSHDTIIMSSNSLKRPLDDSGGGPTGPDAKRRKFRACVTCRRQKARCEFVNAHDRCHRCSVLQIPCVFEGQAHANLLAASAPIASSQSGLPFPHGPPAVPSAYDNSPKLLPRPSAGSEHARYVLSPSFNSSRPLTHPIIRINTPSDDQIRSLQRRLATIESALRACLQANSLPDLKTFSPQPHVQQNPQPSPLHKPQGEPSPASLHGATSSSVSAHQTMMSHRSDLPLLGSEDATWRHPVKSTYLYFHGMDGPGVDNGRPPNPCGARILSDTQGDQLLRL
jgi:hypothetical protein